MLVFIAVSLATNLTDLPEWNALYKKYNDASGLLLRFERTIDDAKQPEICTLKFQAPSRFWFESKGVERCIWSGEAGIQIDLVKRTYRPLTKMPHYATLSLIPRAELTYLPHSRLFAEKKAVKHNGVNCVRIDHAPPKWVSDTESYTWYVDPRSNSLVAWAGEFYNGVSRNWVGKVYVWVVEEYLNPPNLKLDLDITPPPGYIKEDR